MTQRDTFRAGSGGLAELVQVPGREGGQDHPAGSQADRRGSDASRMAGRGDAGTGEAVRPALRRSTGERAVSIASEIGARSGGGPSNEEQRQAHRKSYERRRGSR